MRTLLTSLVIALLTVASFAQQSISMTLGQSSQPSFTVTDSLGATVPASGYTVTATFSDPTIADYSGFTPVIHGLKLGSTTVTWTITGKASSGYTGTVSLGPDTVTVNPKSLSSASVSYSAPQ
jgi:hypothetical protein